MDTGATVIANVNKNGLVKVVAGLDALHFHVPTGEVASVIEEFFDAHIDFLVYGDYPELSVLSNV